MNDRHKTPRVFASGSRNRKLQAERNKKSEETLAKTSKLTNFFKSSNKEEIPQDPKKTVGDSTEDGDVLQDEATFCGLKNDIGLWFANITKEMIEYWAKKGSTELQNCDQLSTQNPVPVYHNEPRDNSNFVRKCTKNMFTRHNKNQEAVNRFWLCFSRGPPLL
ncbi:hypothetical protein QTP88_004364 [Uroleucon formosanum]